MNKLLNGVYRKLLRICTTHKDVDLSKLSHIKVGGSADIVVYPTCIGDVIKVLDAIKGKTDYIVLGNLTNVLIEAYHGVIIVLSNNFAGVRVVGNTIVANSGCPLSRVCSIACENALSGMQALCGIPGTVGGAVAMNAGAHGTDVSNVVSSVLAITNGKVRHYNNKQCDFAYRSSTFGESIILCVEFTLVPGIVETIKSKMFEYLQTRKLTQPLDMPSLGCTFKNVGQVSAGKLIDDEGFKGYQVGGAKVSDKHANFIVNTGNATFEDVNSIIDKITKHMHDKHDIDMQTEIKIIKEKSK